MGMFNFPVPGSGVCLEGFFGSKAAVQLDAESYSLPDWACFHFAPVRSEPLGLWKLLAS